MIKAKIAILGLFTAVLLCGSYIKSPIEITRASEPDFKDDFESLNTKASLNVSYSTNVNYVSLVSSTSDLVDGDTYLIGTKNDGTGYFMSTSVMSGAISGIEINDSILNEPYNSNLGLLTLKMEKDSTSTYFKTMNYSGSYQGYLSISATSGDTQLLVNQNKDTTLSAFTTAFQSGSFFAMYKRSGESGSYKIRWTGADSGFKAIKTGSTVEVYLYKLVNKPYGINKTNNNKNNIGLRFSGIVPMAMYDAIVSTITPEWWFEYSIGSGTTQSVQITNGVFVKGENDINGVSKEEAGDTGFFRYSIVIKEIPSKQFGTVINARAIVASDYSSDIDVCYMGYSAYSVNTIALAYINEGKASGHEGFLTWLKDYKG